MHTILLVIPVILYFVVPLYAQPHRAERLMGSLRVTCNGLLTSHEC